MPRLLVLEREAEPRFRIGETLPGAAGPLLRDLGSLTGFIARCYPKSLGRASIWGSEELVRTDSFNDPQGSGWKGQLGSSAGRRPIGSSAP